MISHKQSGLMCPPGASYPAGENEMTNRYSYDDVARDFNLWGQCVDPHATMTEEEFNSMTLEEKIALLRKLFGDEQAEEEDL